MKLEDWLEALAAKRPTPGGGAAAGLAAATAAALVGMVSIYTTGKRWADRETEMRTIHEQAAVLRQQALELIMADEAAFAAVGQAYALPKETPAQQTARQTAIQSALVAAAAPPRQVAIVATEIVTLAANLVSQGNPNVVSDVAVAASFARTAVESAIVNIEINAALIKDASVKENLTTAIEGCQLALQEAEAVVSAVRKRMVA